MTFWLRRWQEQSRSADRPCGAVAVGDHLHLDVAGRRRSAAPCSTVSSPNAWSGLGAGAGERGLEAGRVVDAADAAPAAAGRGLDHQRVADRLGVARGVLDACRPARRSRARPARRPPRRAAWPRSCRRGGASPRSWARRTRSRAARTARRTRGSSATKPQPTQTASARAGDERPLERLVVEIADAAPSVSSGDAASSASRTNIAWRSGSAWRARSRGSAPRGRR